VRHLEQPCGSLRFLIGVDGPRLGGTLDPQPGTPEDQQVEVQFARTPSTAVLPTKGPLDPLERRQESDRSRRRVRSGGNVERDDSVSELRLVGDTHGSGGVQTRNSTQANAWKRSEGRDGSSQRGLQLADVGAEADIGANPSRQAASIDLA
jgi:hypothetical protein